MSNYKNEKFEIKDREDDFSPSPKKKKMQSVAKIKDDGGKYEGERDDLG